MEIYKDKKMNSGNIIEALQIYDYTQRTAPAIAARNNNESGRKYIQDCITRNVERFTEDELASIKKWWLEFYKEARKIAKSERKAVS